VIFVTVCISWNNESFLILLLHAANMKTAVQYELCLLHQQLDIWSTDCACEFYCALRIFGDLFY